MRGESSKSGSTEDDLDVAPDDRRSRTTDRSSSATADDWPPVETRADAASSDAVRARARPPEEVTARVADVEEVDPGVAPETTTPARGASPGDERVESAADEPDEVAGVIAEGDPQVGTDLLEDYSFALCLTHDVDRPFKLVQAIFYALRDRDPGQLRALLPGHQPNWTFDRMMAIEEELGVRSAFYFLDEQRLFRDRPWRDWLDPDAWRLYADRYAVDDPPIVDLIHRLDAGGWEVGLHGSYESYDDRERLRREKRRLEGVLGRPVRGGRQHYLNRTLPDTWEHHAALGLDYDATLGSATGMGFQYGDTIARPFDDDFVAFPLTIMDVAVPDPGDDFEAAKAACDRILRNAADRGAIATLLWHPRMFNERDWPGHASLYRFLIERALELDAWVGPPTDVYERLDHPE